MPTDDDVSLFGITDSWNVVLFGENSGLPRREELDYAAHKIDKTTDGVSTNRTLFSDVFGATAMETIFIPPTSTITSTVGQIGLQALSSLSAPAYLAPPIESLYSSLMGSFMTQASESELKEAAAADKQDEQDDNDMVVDTEPASVPSLQTRTVDDREVEMLASFFSSQSLSMSCFYLFGGVSTDGVSH